MTYSNKVVDNIKSFPTKKLTLIRLTVQKLCPICQKKDNNRQNKCSAATAKPAAGSILNWFVVAGTESKKQKLIAQAKPLVKTCLGCKREFKNQQEATAEQEELSGEPELEDELLTTRTGRAINAPARFRI